MHLGKGTSVSLGLSSMPLGFFSGRTRRMSLISLTLFFIEFRMLRRSRML
ncbi:MAG: hypothetical protein ACYC4K_01070 [Thiobacillus sp.]